MRRLKVLCSAYACEPGAGSEPGVGWNLVTALAEHHDVWVLTRSNNRPAIEAELRRQPRTGLEFVYFDLPEWARGWKKGARGLRMYYRLWQGAASRPARRLVQRFGIDVAQHVTFAQYWTPAFVRRLAIPYVWGPVGGAEVFPRCLYPVTSLRAAGMTEARLALHAVGEREPAVKATARRSSTALASTPETAARLRRLGAPRVEILNQAALTEDDLARIPAREAASISDEVRFLSATRFLGTKGVELGIRAFLAADIGNATYEIAGDGAERQRLESLVARAGAGDRIRFAGRLTRAELLKRYARADVLVHLSPAESGGFACLEAMAAGLPVVYLGAGGPPVLVPEGAGMRIEIAPAWEVVESVAAALHRLADEPSLRRRLGESGRRHVYESGTWRSRAPRLAALLREAVESS